MVTMFAACPILNINTSCQATRRTNPIEIVSQVSQVLSGELIEASRNPRCEISAILPQGSLEVVFLKPNSHTALRAGICRIDGQCPAIYNLVAKLRVVESLRRLNAGDLHDMCL